MSVVLLSAMQQSFHGQIWLQNTSDLANAPRFGPWLKLKTYTTKLIMQKLTHTCMLLYNHQAYCVDKLILLSNSCMRSMHACYIWPYVVQSPQYKMPDWPEVTECIYLLHLFVRRSLGSLTSGPTNWFPVSMCVLLLRLWRRLPTNWFSVSMCTIA